MSIEYSERGGKLWFSAKIETTMHQKHFLHFYSGKIPEKVVQQGAEAIRRYTERRVKIHTDGDQAKHDREAAFERNPDVSVSVEHDGVLLRGRIIGAHWNNNLEVLLEDPGKAQAYQHTEKTPIFSKTRELTKEGLKTAQKLLIIAYRKWQHHERHGNVIDLAEQLNKRSEP